MTGTTIGVHDWNRRVSVDVHFEPAFGTQEALRVLDEVYLGKEPALQILERVAAATGRLMVIGEPYANAGRPAA